MRGAIAAGHPLTAEAGARVLAAGGNAVDACVGAAFVSWVCESPLTGPGGGGFMLVHEAADGRTRRVRLLRDGAAGRDGRRGRAAASSTVDFDGDTQQVFHTGAAAVGGAGDGARPGGGAPALRAACRGRSSSRRPRGWRARASS